MGAPAEGRRRARTAVGLAVALVVAISMTAAVRPRRQDPTTTTTTSSTTTEATTSTTGATTTSTAPSTTSTTTAPAPDCGATLTKADGTPWVCTFADEFAGTTLGAAWMTQRTASSGFTSGQECFEDGPDNVAVADGVLDLTARKEAAPFSCHTPNKGDFTTQYTSGSVMTMGRFSQAYGRFEVRAAFPPVAVPGLQSALWLWPDNSTRYGPWPWSGEIDFAEAYSKYADRVIPYIHYAPAVLDWNVTNNYCLVHDISAFHTYAVAWTTDSITVTFDGQTCLVDTWVPSPPLVKPQPFDQPFMVALTQLLGVGANKFDPNTTPLPATTKVDYVHVWR